MMKPATIELAPSGELTLTLPSGLADGRDQVVTIPPDDRGMAILVRVLNARNQEQDRGYSPHLGLESEPTQAMVEEWLRHNKPTRTRPDPEDKLIAELDDDLDLELNIEL